MTGIYSNHYALNFERFLVVQDLSLPQGLKLNLKPSTASIVLKDSSKRLNLPA